MASERRSLGFLALIGLATVGLYALLAGRYPLASSLLDPRAGWVDLTWATWTSLSYHIAIYLSLTVLYVLALRLLTRTEGSLVGAQRVVERRLLAIVVLVWLVCSGILLTAAASGESHDIFDYIFRGRMMSEFAANPLVDVPLQHRSEPYFRYVAWHSFVDAYGPLWEMFSFAASATTRAVLTALGSWSESALSCPLSPASCRSLMGYITAYRLLAIGVTGLSGMLVVSMVKRQRPHLAAAALAAWLWSPLLLISTAVGAHNDALLILLLLLTLWLLQRRRWFLALLALILAAHVKITVLIVAPAVGLWLVRRCGWRRSAFLGAAAVVAGLALSWLLYAPFGGWSSLPRMLSERTEHLANSPWRVLFLYLDVHLDWPREQARGAALQLSFLLSTAGVLLASLWLLDFRPRRWKAAPAPDWRDDRHLWLTIAVVSLLYLFLGAFWFQHWYVAWVLAPAVLLPELFLTRWLLPWLGFGALAANVAASFAPALAPNPPSKTAIALLTVVIIWLPLLLATTLKRPVARRQSG